MNNSASRIVILTALIFIVILSSWCQSSKNTRKDRSSNNQMEQVHPVRHMASMMRRMLAEDTETTDANATTLPTPPETPSVATTTRTTPIPSTSIVVETASQKQPKSNQTLSRTPMDYPSDFEPTCPSYLPCEHLNAECIVCNFNYSCVYGEEVSVSCHVRGTVNCQGTRDFSRRMVCQFCYQTPPEEHECTQNVTCKVVSSPRQRFISRCTVFPHVLCLGIRDFSKNLFCNWSKGYSWTTTLVLSVVLGGFGVDRFYLGMWQEGIGKLFSFGGLGVWTLVDVVLIATGYLGPADGSLYIP